MHTRFRVVSIPCFMSHDPYIAYPDGRNMLPFLPKKPIQLVTTQSIYYCIFITIFYLYFISLLETTLLVK